MLALQAEGGLWRQVLDAPGSAPELTVTAMSLAALDVAASSRWLAADLAGPAIQRGWAAIAQRGAGEGGFTAVCASTPAGPTLAFYLERPMVTGRDDRAAALVLLAALT